MHQGQVVNPTEDPLMIYRGMIFKLSSCIVNLRYISKNLETLIVIYYFFTVIELIRRFSKSEDMVGGAFGGADTACLAANVERRSSIYIDKDRKQSEACRPRWSHAQGVVMGEHLRFVKKGDESYIKRLATRSWMFPQPTSLHHKPITGKSKVAEGETKALLKAEGFGKELEAYNKSFTSMIRDPFDQLFVHPAGSTAAEVPQWLKEEAYTFKEAGETKKKV